MEPNLDELRVLVKAGMDRQFRLWQDEDSLHLSTLASGRWWALEAVYHYLNGNPRWLEELGK